MKRTPALLVILPTALLAACSLEPDDSDPDESPLVYRVSGRALPLDPSLPPPAAAAMTVTVRESWAAVLDGGEDPFPPDAAILDRPDLRGDLTYESLELEGAGLVAVYLDDAPGQPDELVRSIVDHRIEDGGDYGLNPPVVWRQTVERWAAGLSIEASELEAAGMMILVYHDRDGRPLAGVSPAALACDLTPVMLSDDLEVQPEETVTGASGAVLFVGAPASLYGYRVAPTADSPDSSIFTVGAGTSPGALFIETLTVEESQRALAGGRLPPEDC